MPKLKKKGGKKTPLQEFGDDIHEAVFLAISIVSEGEFGNTKQADKLDKQLKKLLAKYPSPSND